MVNVLGGHEDDALVFCLKGIEVDFIFKLDQFSECA